ncbi:response regulator [Cohnella thailandensis]|uniref:Response regulator n=1 Tax=Cohnella thailandensis TaxID=557557 RepID=A0A841SUP5_9BACL|nr:response regulator [Cohnella thailandensis]MBB6633600.1 response regulator [Cohnella thailandensis]MBP1974619.1 two-component system response regulator YesN [Cohnella thailandensis]
MFKAVIIDDELNVRARLRELIDWEELGFVLAGEADNGEDAYRLLLAEKPDLAITDIRIPVFNGLELIRKAIPELPHCHFILLSGYGDFEYAREAIRFGVRNYLLKPVGEEELRLAVRTVKEELVRRCEQDRMIGKGMEALREKWAADALHGANASGLPQRATELKLTLEDVRYSVFVVDWTNEGEASHDEAEEEEKLLDTLFRLAIEQALLPFGNPIIVTDEQERYIVLHLAPVGPAAQANGLSRLEPRVLAQRVLEQCGEVLDGQVTVGYGEAVARLADVSSSFAQAVQAVEGKFVLGRNKAIGYPDVAGNSAAGSWNKLAEFDRSGLEEAIRSLDLDNVRNETKRLFSALRELSSGPALIRGILTENLVAALRILIRIHGDAGEVLGDGFKLDDWFDKLTLDELEGRFYDVCAKIVDYIRLARRNRPGKLVEQMQDYIDENYAEEITLKSISRIFFMNPVYLGQLFKSETGIGYHQYLTQVRIRAAKKLLDEKDWGVSEIAERVGYKVARNFYIAFKKYAHCTPNEYRSRGQASANDRPN